MKSTHQRLNVKHATPDLTYTLPKDAFANWLVGFTDGDGCFSFSVNKRKNSIWNCTFKIAQTTYNLRCLYFIKKELGYGTINKRSGKNMAEFRIRERKTLINLIVPLFTQYPLYSTKQFYFLQWVKALETLDNQEYTSAEKNEILTQLKKEVPNTNPPYLSPSWERRSPTDEWIAGFIEAEGSFFLTLHAMPSAKQNPLPVRIVHAFGITQKLDGVILEFLREKLHIPSKVEPTKREIYKLQTTNSRSIVRIRDFFLNKLKGIKSLQYKIWARSLKWKGNPEKLLKVQEQLRRLRGTPCMKV